MRIRTAVKVVGFAIMTVLGLMLSAAPALASYPPSKPPHSVPPHVTPALPFTGANIVGAFIVFALLLVAGVSLFAASRSRRRRAISVGAR